MTKIRAIISDADGTLVNTVYLIRHGQYEATADYLMEKGVPRRDIPTYEVYESYINKGVGGSTRETLEKTLRLLYGETHEHHLGKIDFDELDQRLTPVQDRIAPLYVHPFHGLTELFSWAGKTQTALGIFTSGTPYMIVRHFGICLPALGYTDLFKNGNVAQREMLQAFIERAKAVYGIPKLVVITCDDVSKTKPDPEGIFKAMQELHVAPDEVITLGDHPADMQAARAAKAHPLGISHGFGTPAELKEAGALRVVDDLASVPKIVDAHNSGKKLLF
jgi:phosphoglycolate phosphatase-like HAD superfamily hydrolase